MREIRTKKDNSLDKALDVSITKSGSSLEEIMGDKDPVAKLTK